MSAEESIDHAPVVEIAGGVRVSVSSSLEGITTYVLREQEAWFEDEWAFLPQVVGAGARILDVGANHGVYALRLARAVGETGHVWAVEPTPETMGHLRRSVVLNGLNNLTPVEVALSDRTGRAMLALNASSELNALGARGSSGSVEVALRTVDGCRGELGWERIDLVKLDAEGEEANVLRGGRALFEEEAPLVMFELKHGYEINHGLIDAFAASGYRTYRLAPGLDALVEFDHGEPVDSYQLNLFACKELRSGALAGAGLLVTGAQDAEDAQLDTGYEDLPFVRRLGRAWRSGRDAAELRRIASALHSLGDRRCGAAQRLATLRRVHAELRHLCQRRPTLGRLCTLARAAWAWGARMEALEALAAVVKSVEQARGGALDEPFVPPLPRFDRGEPGEIPGRWFMLSVFEAVERLRSYSSFYEGVQGMPLLERLRTLGCASPEMERRRQLVGMRLGRQRGPQPSPLLADRSRENLNPDYWAGR